MGLFGALHVLRVSASGLYEVSNLGFMIQWLAV